MKYYKGDKVRILNFGRNQVEVLKYQLKIFPPDVIGSIFEVEDISDFSASGGNCLFLKGWYDGPVGFSVFYYSQLELYSSPVLNKIKRLLS